MKLFHFPSNVLYKAGEKTIPTGKKLCTTQFEFLTLSVFMGINYISEVHKKVEVYVSGNAP